MSNFFGHNSTVYPVHWQESPNSRGTFDIISSCVITLCLCLWTALHLNIPEHHGASAQKWRKCGWLLVGLLAPELVVFTALEQRRAAFQLTKQMQILFGDKPDSEWPKILRWLRPTKCSESFDEACLRVFGKTGPARSHRWTHVHSFYANMGGFAFDTSSAPVNFLPSKQTRLTIRPKGLRYIAEHAPSLIPDLSEEEIRDKSKADGLAKLLVCLQALWFCLQCVVRLAQNQYISFLELNTFAHALCALLAYGLWWHKPLDIENPSFLVGNDAWDLCALMCVASVAEFSSTTASSQAVFLPNVLLHNDYFKSELISGEKYGARVMNNYAGLFNGQHKIRLREQLSQPRAVFRWNPVPSNAFKGDPKLPRLLELQRPSANSAQIRKGDSLFGFCCTDVYTQADLYRLIPPCDGYCSDRTTGHSHNPTRVKYRDQNRAAVARIIGPEKPLHPINQVCFFDSSDLDRWARVSRAWRTYLFTDQLYNGVGDRIRNWPVIISHDTGRNDAKNVFSVRIMTFTIATGLYGGLHLLAWAAPFPSRDEQDLWRASSLLVVATGIAISWSAFVMKYLGGGNGIQQLVRGLVAYVPLDFLMYSVPFYLLAGGFLVVYPCVQLARLPPGAYSTPEWSKYYPHIG